MKALNDVVLLEVEGEAVETKAGIVLQGEAASWGPIGRVTSVGPKVEGIEVGDWVMCDTRFVENEMVKGVPYRWTRQLGVLTILDQEEIDAEIVPIRRDTGPSIVHPATGETAC